MSTAYYVTGDVRAVLADIPDGSIDLVITSPPFLALRSYLPPDDPAKVHEIGQEATPGEFIDTLLDITEELHRVLTPWGSICVELGDTYAGSGGGGDYLEGGLREGQQQFAGSAASMRESNAAHWRKKNERRDEWPADKSMCLIPELYRLALVYGFNPLTGRETIRWRVRNVIDWCRPNPPVGALGDKFRPASSDIVIACKTDDAGRRRYFDLDAVRTPHKPHTLKYPRNAEHYSNDGYAPDTRGDGGRIASNGGNDAGAPPLDWWEIPTAPYRGSHYACVDADTEALTPNGWRRHDELEDGGTIAAYDRERGILRWEPATFHRYAFDGELVAIDKRETSQRLTPNHRVIHRTGRGRIAVRPADEARSSWSVPVAAPFPLDGHGPGIERAALLGWFIAEGSARARTVRIYQSESANPKHCARIRDLLDAVGAEYTERRRVRGESIEIAWSIGGDVARWLLDTAPAKALTGAVVFGWSEDEATALLDALIDGDGHTRASGRRQFVQKDRATIDMVQALCSRLGLRSTISQRRDGTYSLTVGERSWLTLRGTNGAADPIGREHYVGTVWCPSVPSSFWLARRKGRPFITGNTYPPALIERPIKAMAPARVCTVCGEPSRRIVEQTDEYKAARSQVGDFKRGRGRQSGLNGTTQYVDGKHMDRAESVTLGWTDCGHDAWRPGRVLDPFGGSGTTGMVATGHGRDAILIDLDRRNVDLARDRIGMFMVETDVDDLAELLAPPAASEGAA